MINMLDYSILVSTIHEKHIKTKKSYGKSEKNLSEPKWDGKFQLTDGLYSVPSIQG